MSKNLPDFDPYTVLGVDKNAPVSEIKTAYRKLVLKCHPDKIQDETLRTAAVDNFQKVQESYEILSDEIRRQLHDQQARLAALRKEVNAQKSFADGYSRGTSSREFRDGRMYEERVPADAEFFSDSDEPRFSEEPMSYSHKYSDSAKRPHTKVTEEKKKAKATPAASAPRFASKHSDREYARAEREDRAKVRTRERRRDASDKYQRKAAYVYSDDEDYFSSDIEPVRSRTTRAEPDYRHSPRESVPRRSKAESTQNHRSRKYYSGSDNEMSASGSDYEPVYYESKLDNAKEYISRKKDPIIQVDRPPRSSRRTDYDGCDRSYWEVPEHGSPRYSSSRSYKSERPAHTSQRSHERLSPSITGYERDRERERTPPSMTSKSSSQRTSSTRAPPPVTRSATAPYPSSRTRREGLSRSESIGQSTLANMVNSVLPSRPRPRGTERNDSGYSSGPGTPEMPHGSSSTTKIRYKVETADDGREPIIVEHSNVRYRESPPPRADRDRERSSTSSRTPKSTRYTTYEPEVRTVFPAAVSSKSTSSPRAQYREIRPSDLDPRRHRPTVAY